MPDFYLSTVSPLNDPIRFIFTFLFGVHFFMYSLRLFRFLNSGVTIILNRHHLLVAPFSFQVQGGQVPLPPAKRNRGYIKSYNPPNATAFLGFLFFTASVILLVIMFKRVDYIY